jgi:hypothetical protein
MSSRVKVASHSGQIEVIGTSLKILMVSGNLPRKLFNKKGPQYGGPRVYVWFAVKDAFISYPLFPSNTKNRRAKIALRELGAAGR